MLFPRTTRFGLLPGRKTEVLFRVGIILVAIAIATLSSVNSRAGEILYNGIELPAKWPPNAKTFPSNDPLPPYLKHPPK